MSHWGSHRQTEEVARSRQAEMEARAARGERNIRHGAGSMWIPLWSRVLTWAVVVVVAAWLVYACANVLTAPEPEEEGGVPGTSVVLFQ